MRKTALSLGLVLCLCAPLSMAQERQLPPAGFGTLTQDDIAVRLNSQNLQWRIIPLDEEVIRLLAPDTYQSLHALRLMRAAQIDSIANTLQLRNPRIMYVTLTAVQPDVRFDPQQLLLSSLGQLYRPLATLPLTLGWSQQILKQGSQAGALFVYSPQIPLFEEAFIVNYFGVTSARWATSMRRLEEERARVFARAASRNPVPARPDSIPR